MRQRSFVRYTALIFGVWIFVAMLRFPAGTTRTPTPPPPLPLTASPPVPSNDAQHPRTLPNEPKHDTVRELTDSPPSTQQRATAQGADRALEASSGGADPDRRDEVLRALRHSWAGYRKHAFGKDEFFPISLASHNWGEGTGLGVTIIDALDTLIMAGLEEEVSECLEWIRTELHFDQPTKVSVFETTIRILGGLLSAYELRKDAVLLEKADDLGTRLLKAFDTPSGVPDNYVNLRSGAHAGAEWNGGLAILSELGSLQVEFRKLSALTGKPVFDRKATAAVEKIRKHCSGGFCPRNFRGDSAMHGSNAGLGSFGDSFYEYLLKIWIMSDKQDSMFKDMWERAAQHVLRTTTTVGEFTIPNGRETGNTMEHLACFSGGLFALSFMHSGEQEHLALAEKIAHTCHAMYTMTPSGLAPDVVRLSGNSFRTIDSKYILRPETVETYFYLWRATKNPKYRDWGYEVLQACNKHLRVDAGYAGAVDVTHLPIRFNDNMETFWFAETLKYLLLLFSDDAAIDLREWVFNTEAHPMRVIRGWRPSS